ncbi:MAG: hypothetical protein ABJA80_12735 [bacterium]
MRHIRMFLPAAVVAVILLASRTSLHARDDAGTREVHRIRVHFDSALTVLQARDLHELTDAQRGHRTDLVRTLRAYRARGVFPHNRDFPGAPTPYFIDRETGTLCAVAHLLASSGRRDIVERVARANNNVWVMQLARDTAFTHWLDANGLSLEEAALIQVPYIAPQSDAQVSRQVGFVAAAPFAFTGALVASGLNLSTNLDGHQTLVTKLGVVSGAVTTFMGSAVMAKTDLTALGASGVLVGVTSMALSVRSMLHHSSALAAREAEQRNTAAATRIVPLVSVSDRPSVGLSVSRSF